jgi:hypothetical protein
MSPKRTRKHIQPNRPLKQLSDLRLDRVSLVPSGDDPMAHVVLVKADPEMSTTFGNTDPRFFPQTGGRYMPPRRYAESEPITKDDLPEEVVEYIDALEDALDVTVDRVQKMEEELSKANSMNTGGAAGSAFNDEDFDEDDEGNEGNDAQPLAPKSGAGRPAPGATAGRVRRRRNDVSSIDNMVGKGDPVSKADPEIRQLIEKQAEEIEKANERAEEAEKIAKSERTQRLTREFVEKASQLPMIAENPQDLGALMMELNALDPAVGEKVEKLFKAANEGLRQGNVFGEIGRHGGSTTSSPAVEAIAEGIRKDNPEMTPEQAVAKAYEDNPELYDEEIREARLNGR